MLNRLKDHGSQIVLALLSGMSLTLAFPKIHLGWLAWVALSPFILAIRTAKPKTGFFIGLSFGMAHYLGLVYWTVYTMHQYGNIPMAQAVMVLILLSGYLSLYPGFFAAAITWLRPKPRHLIFIAPLLWVCLEMIRNTLFTGFPWQLLGYSQYRYLWIIQISDLFGVYGLSALIVAANTVVALSVLNWLELPWLDDIPTRKSVARNAILLAAAMATVIGYGIHAVSATDKMAAAADRASIAVIQGNIDQASKWDPRFQVMTTVKYRRFSLEPTAKNADLIIWPETATPFYFLDDKILTQMVLEGIQKTHAHFIIGSPSYAGNEAQHTYHNSAYLISPQGETMGKYDKSHLVPFGEYVPLKRFLPFIDKMVAQTGDFKPGPPGRTLHWNDHRVGMLICYEAIFPELARAMVRNGADLLVNITNDAWFGRTGAACQHLSMAAFRAVENRRFLARAANTGISAFIDPSGRILDSTPLFQDAVITRPAALMTTRSFYSRWADWPLGIVAFAVALLLIARKLVSYNWS